MAVRQLCECYSSCRSCLWGTHANGTLYAKEEKIEEEIVEDFEADEAVDLEEVAEFEAEFAENEEIEE